jgi:hypothetical protein
MSIFTWEHDNDAPAYPTLTPAEPYFARHLRELAYLLADTQAAYIEGFDVDIDEVSLRMLAEIAQHTNATDCYAPTDDVYALIADIRLRVGAKAYIEMQRARVTGWN